MKTKVSRKRLIQLMCDKTWLCETAFEPHNTFMSAGLRTVHQVTSFGAELMCGAGSPHVGRVSDLRFEKGDECYKEDNRLWVVGKHVTIRYTVSE